MASSTGNGDCESLTIHKIHGSHSLGSSNDYAESFSIEGLIIDRSISAPPPNLGVSLKSDEKWSYSGDLSLTRKTWREATDSLYSLPIASDFSNTNTWESTSSRARAQVHTSNHEILDGLSAVSSPLPLTQRLSMRCTENRSPFNNTATTHSDPTITGSSYEMNSVSLLESSSVQFAGSVNPSANDQWNQYGMNLRRPASTGVIGRNSIKEGQYSVFGSYNNPTGNQITSIKPTDNQFLDTQKYCDQSSSLKANCTIGKGHRHELGRGPETTMVNSSVLCSKDHERTVDSLNNEINLHLLQQLQSPQTHTKSICNSTTYQATKRVDAHGQNNPTFLTHLQNHPLPIHIDQKNPLFSNNYHLPETESMFTNLMYTYDGRRDGFSPLNKVSDGHTTDHTKTNFVLLNQLPSVCENPNYRNIIPDRRAYPSYSTTLSVDHGQLNYLDSASLPSNVIISQQQQHFYSAATLPISVHHGGQLSPPSPTYAYFVVQPQQHSSIFVPPQGGHIHIPLSAGHSNLQISPSIVVNHDNEPFSSMHNSNLNGRKQNEDHEKSASNIEKMKRNKISKSNLSVSKKSNRTSSLLEEFRVAKNQSWTSFTIKGHIGEFAQDQNGSRFIQQRLEVADDGEKNLLLEEILFSIDKIQNDVFGNYVIQKLFEVGTTDMKIRLKEILVGDVVSLSKMMYGCRVVQKALESLNNEDLPVIAHGFKGNLVECILDQNGNHVIQKCIEVFCVRAKTADSIGDSNTAMFLRQNCQFIINTSLESLSMLSCHPFGCRVIQRIIEHCVDPNFTRALDTISSCHKELLDDQYGNYVIQHLLQYGRNLDKETIMRTVLESGLVKLSRQKYASNVVEKLLKYGTPMVRGMIIKDMLKEGDSETGTSAVLLMVRDAYANYVVQTALDVAPEGHIKRLFVQELSKHSSQLRNYTFAKHIVAKLGSS